MPAPATTRTARARTTRRAADLLLAHLRDEVHGVLEQHITDDAPAEDAARDLSDLLDGYRHAFVALTAQPDMTRTNHRRSSTR